MPRRIHFGTVILFSVALLLAGCSATSSSTNKSARGAGSKAKPASSVPREDSSAEAMEKRADAHAHYAAAIVHDWNDESDLAAGQYYQAALADPANESMVLEVAQRLIQLKEHEKARDVLAKATGTAGASGVLFAQLGRVYALLGKKELAMAANRTAIKKMPRSLLGYRYLAQIYLQDNQQEEGLKVLDQAARQPDVDAAFLIELAELYTSFARAGSGQNVKPHALETFNRAAKLSPKNPVLLQKLADGFALLGETDQAIELYLKLLDRLPGLPGLRERLTDLYLHKQDRKHAAEQLEAIIRDTPTNPQAYFFLGRIAYQEKKMKEATEYFSKTMLLNPDFEPVYYYMAEAQLNLNQPNEALETLEKAKTKFQQNFSGEFLVAMAYARMKNYTNAIGHLTAAEVIARATDTNLLDRVFYFQVGSVFERNQQYQEAEKSFQRSLELSPDFSEALNYLGYMWAERGVNLARARELIEKAVKLEPENAAFLDSLGWVLFKLDKPKEALTYLLKSIENSADPDATLYDHLGDIYSSLHQTDKARQAWRKSISIEPNEQIQKKLGTSPVSEAPAR